MARTLDASAADMPPPPGGATITGVYRTGPNQAEWDWSEPATNYAGVDISVFNIAGQPPDSVETHSDYMYANYASPIFADSAWEVTDDPGIVFDTHTLDVPETGNVIG